LEEGPEVRVSSQLATSSYQHKSRTLQESRNSEILPQRTDWHKRGTGSLRFLDKMRAHGICVPRNHNHLGHKKLSWTAIRFGEMHARIPPRCSWALAVSSKCLIKFVLLDELHILTFWNIRMCYLIIRLHTKSIHQKVMFWSTVGGHRHRVSFRTIHVFDWCCSYYFVRNSLVALLEILFATRCQIVLLHGRRRECKSGTMFALDAVSSDWDYFVLFVRAFY